MENLSVDDVYKLVGELYVNNRVRSRSLEEAFKELSVKYQKLVEEHNQVLAEFQHVKNHVSK